MNPLNTKPHYPILDGLRGVAAIVVVIFHIFEAHSAGPLYQIVNHGYLAVDFFFLLSGFVISYAYDDRWGKMSVGSFFKRRLVRLHPLVIMGMVIGAVFFLFPGFCCIPGHPYRACLEDAVDHAHRVYAYPRAHIHGYTGLAGDASAGRPRLVVVL